LTATRALPGQPAAARHASRSTHSPMGTISPVSSATGMNSVGVTEPRAAESQRSSASSPETRLALRSTSGW